MENVIRVILKSFLNLDESGGIIVYVKSLVTQLQSFFCFVLNKYNANLSL